MAVSRRYRRFERTRSLCLASPTEREKAVDERTFDAGQAHGYSRLCGAIFSHGNVEIGEIEQQIPVGVGVHLHAKTHVIL